MFISKINNVLDADTLAKARRIIQAAEYTDGKISGGNTMNKKNLELSPETDKYVEVLKLKRICSECVDYRRLAPFGTTWSMFPNSFQGSS